MTTVLRNVFPTLPSDYLSDGHGGHSEVRTELLDRSLFGRVQHSDSHDLFFGQDCTAVGFPPRNRAVRVHVLLIVGVSVPPQVDESVVGAFGVGEMTALHSFGTGADECFEDDATDEERPLLSGGGVCKPYCVVAVFGGVKFQVASFNLCGHELDDLVPAASLQERAGDRLDASEVGYAVDSVVAGDVPPVLDRPVVMLLDAFVEKMSEVVPFGHDRLPFTAPCSGIGQAAGITALRVIGPSPSHSMEGSAA